MSSFLWNSAGASPKGAMPILSFPATQKLRVTVGELVHSASLQAQAMTYVASHTPTIAAVSLMDLSVEAEAFGAQVSFSDWEVPAVRGRLVKDPSAAATLRVPSLMEGRAPLCVQAVKLAKEQIVDKPVLAGVIGPFSLAGRLMGVSEIMYACFDMPDAVHTVLEKAAEYITTYCRAFQAVGADGVVMAEPLAGLLDQQLASEFSCTWVRRILADVQSEAFPVIYHNCGNTAALMLPELFAMGAAAYHFGNAVKMEDVLAQAPADRLCMGNIDPAGQFVHGDPASMRGAVRELMDRCGGYPNFIPSSGCDIPAQAGWENIEAFFAALEE
ncbi:MAG: uroporphyrinogen decarboxylase family protein [Oscillospiraceae bacterium]|nr:uroporphyrinogen decarboxylase family protein [Oscillospiraceae bacterium]